MGQMFALVTFPCGGMAQQGQPWSLQTVQPAQWNKSVHGEYRRSCNFHTRESLLGIFAVAAVVLPGPWGFAKQPHGHRKGSKTGGDADRKVIFCAWGRERRLRGR